MTLSKTWRQFRLVMIAIDSITIFGTYVIADMARCHLRDTDWPELIGGEINSVRVQAKVLVFLPFAWPVILNTLGWYNQRWRSWRWVLRKGVAASVLLGLLISALALLFERELYPRMQIALVVVLLPATTAAARGISTLLGRWMGSRQSRGVVIVGTGREAVRIRRLLRSVAFDRPTLVANLRGPWERDSTPDDHDTDDIGQLGPILDRNVVDEVIFAAPLEELPNLLPYVALCEEVGVTAHVPVESSICHSIPEIVNFHGVPLLAYSPAQHSPEMLGVKRFLDVGFAIIGITVTAPIIIGCAIAVWLTCGRPILFRQRRSGLNGREFWMYKFRTMEPDAESKLAEIAHLNEYDGPAFKAVNDPRVTRVGAVLRRWSLDEFPQLFNVLFGDMSIVGPRPPIPDEVENYDRWQRRRLSMRPGLTCLWQIKGRHRIGFEEWMKLDLFYIDHWSLKLDFLIICKTIPTVLSGSGA
ncbi:MAG: sugar transferase [Planctomycetota bacterium]|nr:sugar transferase [Planctomycetota bacterium]